MRQEMGFDRHLVRPSCYIIASPCNFMDALQRIPGKCGDLPTGLVQRYDAMAVQWTRRRSDFRNQKGKRVWGRKSDGFWNDNILGWEMRIKKGGIYERFGEGLE